MNQRQSFFCWLIFTLFLLLAWVHDPWAPPPTTVLAGVHGAPVMIRVERDRRWVEYRIHEKLWYIHSYTKEEGEADDPYRLAEGAKPGTPTYEGLVGDKDRKIRRMEGLNAIMADVLVLLAQKPCERTFQQGQLDKKKAGFAKGGLTITIYCGEQKSPTTVAFGAPSPFGQGFYYAVPRFNRFGIVTPALVKFVSLLLKREFEEAGQAAGQTTVRLDALPSR